MHEILWNMEGLDYSDLLNILPVGINCENLQKVKKMQDSLQFIG